MDSTVDKHMESPQRYISLEEIQQKIEKKQMWISYSLERMGMLPKGEQYSMWNHLTDLHRELAVLEEMERTAKRGIRVCRSRIYWEPIMDEEAEVSEC